jgi:hypothetical protein
MRCIEALRCLAHTSGLHHGHEDVKVLQLHSASDAIVQLHGGTNIGIDMTSSDNSIMRSWEDRIIVSIRLAVAD